MIDLPDALAPLEQPEYTGENRCLPCTVVNVAIAIGLAGGITAISVPVGALSLGVFLVLIYLRGYLVPGTPTLTRRYLPGRVLERFGKAEPSTRRPTIETGALDDAVESLSAADVVRRRAEGNGLRLTTDFRERWDERLASAKVGDGEGDDGRERRDEARTTDPDDVAALVDADEIERRGDAVFELDGARSLRWESGAALAADVAADRELRGRLEGWTALDPDERRDVRSGLRLLRERCPACGGRLETRRERLEHCCRRPRVALENDCADCGRSIAAVAVSESSPLLEWVPERDVAA